MAGPQLVAPAVAAGWTYATKATADYFSKPGGILGPKTHASVPGEGGADQEKIRATAELIKTTPELDDQQRKQYIDEFNKAYGTQGPEQAKAFEELANKLNIFLADRKKKNEAYQTERTNLLERPGTRSVFAQNVVPTAAGSTILTAR